MDFLLWMPILYFTWVLFLTRKNDAFHAFTELAKKGFKTKRSFYSCIRNDYGGEIENHNFVSYRDGHGMKPLYTTTKWY